MAMDQHPSRRPSPPRKPPSDREGQGKRESGQAGVPYGAKHEFDGYEHTSKQHVAGAVYGHQKSLKHMAPHKSEFHKHDGGGGGKDGGHSESTSSPGQGGAGGYRKAGDQKADDSPG